MGRDGTFRHLLLPSAGSALLLALLWAFRLTALVALTGYDYAPGPLDAPGFVWDALLVLAGQVLSRAVWATGTRAPRLRRALALLLGLLAVVGMALVRAADVAYAAIIGVHWDSPGFRYLEAENLELLADGHGAGLLLAVCVVVLLGALGLYLDQRRTLHRTGGRPLAGGVRALAPPLAAAVATLVGVLGLGFGNAGATPLRHVPEANFVYHLLVWRGVLDRAESFSPPSDVLSRLRQRGLAPRGTLRADYPLWRADLDEPPFPHPLRPDAPERPNLVFTLVEQLNHDFVHAFSGSLRGAMPQLDRLAQRMTMVTDYRSTTAPTIHALTASLCSVYGLGQHRKLNEGEGAEALADTPLRCLPALLRERGYRTVFIQGGRKAFSGKEAFLRAQGFDEMHGLSELIERYPEPPPWKWGAHDHTLVRYVQDEIERLEALQKKDGRPFFLAMLTLDMHAPGKIPWSVCKPPGHVVKRARGDRASRYMLRALHCSDRALGTLGRFLLDDAGRKQRTAWMLTGDHPTYAIGFVRDLYHKRGRAYRGWIERLPLLIHDPRHALPRRVPVLSGHTDLAPTLLHMLGITDVENAMTGHSIFGRRPALPLLVGRQGPKLLSIYTPKDYRALRLPAVERRCDAGKPALGSDPEALSACDLRDWARWQRSLWQARRIAPVGARP